MDLIVEGTLKRMVKWEDINDGFYLLGESVSGREHLVFLNTWLKEDSPVRILFILRLHHYDNIVPDIENMVVFSTEDPEVMVSRW